jgi:hypothetical protein
LFAALGAESLIMAFPEGYTPKTLLAPKADVEGGHRSACRVGSPQGIQKSAGRSNECLLGRGVHGEELAGNGRNHVVGGDVHDDPARRIGTD